MNHHQTAMAPSKSSRYEPVCRLLQLPHPLIMDILSRLHIKDLLHCRCVCKTFLCFVSDHEFACLHLSRSPLCILARSDSKSQHSERLQLAHVDAGGVNFQVSKLNLTPNVPDCDIIHMSACNGLICLVGIQDKHSFEDVFYVCNPILGEYITIQPPYKHGHRSTWGLGYSSVTNQYKILASYCLKDGSTDRKTAEIYTVGTGTWRNVGNAPTDFVTLPFNAFLNGALHWSHRAPDSSELILSFDFNAEQFRRIPLPDYSEKDNTVYPLIGVLEGCLFTIHYDCGRQFEIWVMKEYGVKESWTKQYVILDMYPNPKEYLWIYYEPMVVLSNGEILMMYYNQEIVCYNQKWELLRGTKLFNFRFDFFALAYTPCFVSLYNVAKGEQISRIQSTRVNDRICKEEFLCL